MKMTSDEQYALTLLRRFPGAGALGGTGDAVARRLVRAAEMSKKLGGDAQLFATLRTAYPDEHATAIAAGLDSTQVEAALWKAHEAELDRTGAGQAGAPAVARDNLSRRKNEATVARRRAQAKASRRANRRR